MDTIKKCFELILFGHKEESRLAARQVRKLLYGSNDRKEKYAVIKNIINQAPEEYSKILEEWQQENLVMAVSVIYYLHDKEKQPDFFFPWLFSLLLHPNGNIRQAAVKMIGNEIGPLTVHIRHPNFKFDYAQHVKPDEADVILYSIFEALNNMLANLWQPKYKRYNYVRSLPSSPYKSVQLLMVKLNELCGDEYFKQMFHSLRKKNS